MAKAKKSEMETALVRVECDGESVRFHIDGYVSASFFPILQKNFSPVYFEKAGVSEVDVSLVRNKKTGEVSYEVR